MTMMSSASILAATGESARGNVQLVTTLGNIDLELYWEHAPKTCRNFFELCRRGYYNNTLIHRVSPGFMFQMGDPTGTGAGGQSVYGEFMDDEFNPALKHTGAGILSMANIAGRPNSNGSQFMITMAPLPHLDGKNTIFGRVSKNFDVCQRIDRAPTGRDERPLTDIKILKTIIKLNAE